MISSAVLGSTADTNSASVYGNSGRSKSASLQPAVMCSVSGPREELGSLGTDYEGVKLAGPFKDGYQSY